MDKIMGKLKHNYNAFQELRTKFLHKQCVISSFLPSFNEFHHNFHIFKISGTTILEPLRRRKKVTTRGIFQKSFSKYKKTSPKLVYS